MFQLFLLRFSCNRYWGKLRNCEDHTKNVGFEEGFERSKNCGKQFQALEAAKEKEQRHFREQKTYGQLKVVGLEEQRSWPGMYQDIRKDKGKSHGRF